MIKDRHLGVSRDVMHSVGRSHLPIFFFWTQRSMSCDAMRSM